MKEKVIRKEVEYTVETIKTETSNGQTKTETTVETKIENDIKLDQETLCSGINNLSGSIGYLTEIDQMLLSEEQQEKLKQAKENIIDSIYSMSKYLKI